MVVQHELWSCTTIGYDDVRLGILWSYDMRLPYRTTILIDFSNSFFNFLQLTHFQAFSKIVKTLKIQSDLSELGNSLKIKLLGGDLSTILSILSLSFSERPPLPCECSPSLVDKWLVPWDGFPSHAGSPKARRLVAYGIPPLALPPPRRNRDIDTASWK